MQTTIFQTADANACMSDDEFLLLRNLVYQESGLWLKEEKKSFIAHRALKRMKGRNIPSYFRYYKLLTDKDGGKDELRGFLDDLTINETSFFRNKPQMDLFAEVVLPKLLAKKREQGSFSLRLWSAGCSTGQEPYSLAIAIRHSLLDFRNWRITILASDLSLSALETAQAGFYGAAKMEGVERKFVDAYFRKADGGYAVSEEIRKLVVFDYHNLMNENGEKDFDVIFCRNVLIYFDEQTQKKVIERFEKALAPGGYLFLGHSETLQGINDHFVFMHHNRGTAYLKK
ncbi:Chemotaxis protein methyltransferase 1 [uncultured bacterium]|nr:Chemotaxis protein methyltransferase 1 [uncultured bacterium]